MGRLWLDSSDAGQDPADADDDKNVAALLYSLGGSFYPCEFFLVIVDGKIDPAQEIIAGAVSFHKSLMRCGDLSAAGFELVRSDKFIAVLCHKFNAHG